MGRDLSRVQRRVDELCVLGVWLVGVRVSSATAAASAAPTANGTAAGTGDAGDSTIVAREEGG